MTQQKAKAERIGWAENELALSAEIWKWAGDARDRMDNYEIVLTQTANAPGAQSGTIAFQGPVHRRLKGGR